MNAEKLKNKLIEFSSKEENEKLQKYLFSKGFRWASGNTYVNYLYNYPNGGYIHIYDNCFTIGKIRVHQVDEISFNEIFNTKESIE